MPVHDGNSGFKAGEVLVGHVEQAIFQRTCQKTLQDVKLPAGV